MKQTKYERDAAIVDAILSKEEITHEDRIILLSVYGVSDHDTGKIEGTTSCDSSCHGCTFCAKMREAAKHDDTIICGLCYDAKQEEYRTNVKLRHSLNLRIMSSVLFTVEELKYLRLSQIVRINSSGDIENVTHAINMINIAYAFPWANVALWSKNQPACEEAFDTIGKPANMIYIASSIHIDKARNLPKYADYTFTVYTKEKIEEALHKGACECNGKKCRECGYKCYFGTWEKGSDIAELLRKR